MDYYLIGVNKDNLSQERFFEPISGVDPIKAVASEILFEGAYVNVYEGGGQRARLATASTANGIRHATGFVKKNCAVGETVEIFPIGENAFHSQLTIGREYFLSNTEPGKITYPVPEGVGIIKQSLGEAIKTSSLYFIKRKYINVI